MVSLRLKGNGSRHTSKQKKRTGSGSGKGIYSPNKKRESWKKR